MAGSMGNSANNALGNGAGDGTENRKKSIIQEKYIQFKSIKQQLERASEQLNQVTGQLEQIDESLSSVKTISGLKQGTEILVPVSSGVFVKALVGESKDFLVNVGQGIVIQKDVPGIEDIMMKQKAELSELQDTISKDILEMENAALSLQKELKQLIG